MAVKGEIVNKGDFVKISYTARLEDGTIIDSTDEEVAKEAGLSERARYGDIVVVVGERHVIEGLDEGLEGKEIGFKGKIEVEPEKAFGEYDPDNKDVVTVTKLKEKPYPGQRIQVGDRYGTVERIIGRRVIVDFNHPYAGKKIIFDVEIKEKIKDQIEKIRALFLLHTAKDVEAKIENGKLIVEVPRGASFDQFFLIGKFRALDDIFRHFEDIKEVEFVERYPWPGAEVEEKEKEEEAEEAKELEEKTDETKGTEEIEGEKTETKHETEIGESVEKVESPKEKAEDEKEAEKKPKKGQRKKASEGKSKQSEQSKQSKGKQSKQGKRTKKGKQKKQTKGAKK